MTPVRTSATPAFLKNLPALFELLPAGFTVKSLEDPEFSRAVLRPVWIIRAITATAMITAMMMTISSKPSRMICPKIFIMGCFRTGCPILE